MNCYPGQLRFSFLKTIYLHLLDFVPLHDDENELEYFPLRRLTASYGISFVLPVNNNYVAQ